MSEQSDDKESWLAAEYALGVLPLDRMRQAEERFETDRTFRARVEEWQEQFSSLLSDVDPVTPSSAVWNRVDERLFGGSAEARTSIWSSLGFWRGVSLTTGAMAGAAMLALAFLVVEKDVLAPAPERPLVATLTTPGETAAFIARLEREDGTLVVRIDAAPDDPAQVPELWVIPGDGTPRSLGVLDRRGDGTIKLDKTVEGFFTEGAALAVSLEPPGGSPTGAPTGPVIAAGKLQPF